MDAVRMDRAVAGLAGLVLGCTLSACGTPSEDAPVRGEATIFAPGVVSTAAPEFSVTFSVAGGTAWFTRASEDRARLTIMETRRVAGEWTVPVTAPFSGEHRDLDPFMSPDGRRLYFSSDRPSGPDDATSDLDTWYVEATGAGWGAPVRLGAPYNTDSTEVFVSATRDGTLYFQSNRDGVDRVHVVTSGGEAGVLSMDTSVVARPGNPLIDPEGRFLVFVGDTGTGPDLYMSCRQGAGFGRARPLGPAVNSPFADFAPALHPDGTALYFTSERPGQMPARSDGARPPGDLWTIPLDAAGVACDG